VFQTKAIWKQTRLRKRFFTAEDAEGRRGKTGIERTDKRFKISNSIFSFYLPQRPLRPLRFNSPINKDARQLKIKDGTHVYFEKTVA
jgi:hypothetical protein